MSGEAHCDSGSGGLPCDVEAVPVAGPIEAAYIYDAGLPSGSATADGRFWIERDGTIRRLVPELG